MIFRSLIEGPSTFSDVVRQVNVILCWRFRWRNLKWELADGCKWGLVSSIFFKWHYKNDRAQEHLCETKLFVTHPQRNYIPPVPSLYFTHVFHGAVALVVTFRLFFRSSGLPDDLEKKSSCHDPRRGSNSDAWHLLRSVNSYDYNIKISSWLWRLPYKFFRFCEEDKKSLWFFSYSWKSGIIAVIPMRIISVKHGNALLVMLSEAKEDPFLLLSLIVYLLILFTELNIMRT